MADMGEGADAERARALLEQADLDPRLKDVVMRNFVSSGYGHATLLALRAVEKAVHEASGLGDAFHGKELLAAAFRERGPLADPEMLPAEREALVALFTGAYGSFRNPPAHRSIGVGPREAAEIVIFANLLLRLLDRAAEARRRRSGADTLGPATVQVDQA